MRNKWENQQLTAGIMLCIPYFRNLIHLFQKKKKKSQPAENFNGTMKGKMK